jgi:hypothetical protein
MTVLVANQNSYVAPMLEAVEYHEVVYEPSSNTKFKGIPTPQLEDAWDSLWQCKLCRLSPLSLR